MFATNYVIRTIHIQCKLIISTNQFSERITELLKAAIDKQRHIPDKQGDKKIDIKTQYVRLKILSGETMGALPRTGLQDRPYQYQRELENHREIVDEDLLTHNDTHKYILIRGRAGIGKSTLLQRLLWKWANDDWATQFKALFLLNVRYLMVIDKEMELAELVCLYSLYSIGSAGTVIDAKWLDENQSSVGFVMGKD